ncbi:MAG: SGNH/GDSL hydrolase family protein [Gemmatimonadetes bacterium]|nr:SGNH/GDSL hydrolase family protein [Gemmatimonadota bacterium]MBK7925295.1 SGNH/GDSL hydrolase family protein [Gemmatimonadota bacterium]
MTDATTAEPTPTRLRRWHLLMLAALGVLVLLGIAEGASRLYLRAAEGYDGAHLYQFRFDPYKNILPAPGYVDTRGIRHNKAGFRRTTEVSREKPAGTYRIFLMGASTAYGLGGLWPHLDPSWPVLPNDSTIDAYLERELGGRFPGTKVEVINAAITSTWTHHHLIYLNQRIIGYQPDMVLFLDGYNDFYFFNRDHDQFDSYGYNLESQKILGDPTLKSLGYGVGWWFYRRSAFIHLLGQGARNVVLLAKGKPVQRPMAVDSAVAGFESVFPRSALKMHERAGLVLRNEGIVPVFMMQPMLLLERGKPKDAVEEKLFQFDVGSWRPGYEEYLHRVVPIARDSEAAMAARVGGMAIDLTDIFRAMPERTYTDYAHLTPLGNRVLAHLVAERIAPAIADKLQQP